MLKPENRPRSHLAEALGKMAVDLSPKDLHYKVMLSGDSLAKIPKLIDTSVLVGLIKGKKRTNGVNLISAPGLGSQLGLSTEVSVIDGVAEEAVTVIVGSISITGLNLGQNSYLSSINKHKFLPPVALNGNLTIFSSPSPMDKVLSESWIQSKRYSNNL